MYFIGGKRKRRKPPPSQKVLLHREGGYMSQAWDGRWPCEVSHKGEARHPSVRVEATNSRGEA